MVKRRQSVGYRGDLIRFIALPPLRSFFMGARRKQFEDQLIAQERRKKLPALFSHYEISTGDPNAWEILVLKLAADHVSGFQAVRVAGAPTKHSVASLSQIYRFANIKQAGRKNKGRKLRQLKLCKLMLADSQFRAMFPKLRNTSASTLRNMLIEARHLRKARLMFLVNRWAVHHLQLDEDGVFFDGDAPPWAYATNPFAKKASR